MRPIRDVISRDSLKLIGIPKSYISSTIGDFKDFGESSLKSVKKFCEEYLLNINDNFEQNRGIFFYGSNGVGKSLLASIILKEAYRNRYTCRRVTFSSYISYYTESWNTPSSTKDVVEQEFYEKYKGVEFLVLEEIGKEIDSKIAKPILEDLLRYREEKGLVTIICSNIKPSVLGETYGASILSLVKGNTTPIKIVGEDRRQDVFKSNKVVKK